MKQVQRIATILSKGSVKSYSNPYAEFDWPEQLGAGEWCFSPELISIHGTPAFAALDDAQKQMLSFWESINFFSLNIHGEKALLHGIADRMYAHYPPEISAYLHHFLGEENKHMTLFGTFCNRYARKVYPSKAMVVPRDYEHGEADFLFFAKVLIFEELVDFFNVAMGKDARLNPLVQQINWYHHCDEARHLTFGRTVTKYLYEYYARGWSEETKANIPAYLADYLRATWREYYNPSVYADAGIEDAYNVYKATWDAAPARKLREKVSRSCIDFFIDNEIFTERPEL